MFSVMLHNYAEFSHKII